jgi:hypothetical protein
MRNFEKVLQILQNSLTDKPSSESDLSGPFSVTISRLDPNRANEFEI